MASQPQQGRPPRGRPAGVGGRPANDHGIIINPTSVDISAIEQAVRRLVQQLAIDELSGVTSPDNVDVRDLIPSEDLDSGADNTWATGTREWTQTGLTADQFNETYVIDGENGQAGGKVVALVVIQNLSSSPATAEVQLKTGNGGIFERLQTEGLLTDEETIGLIADPIVNLPDKTTAVEQYVTSTADNLVFQGAVAEKAGSTLEESSRFATDRARNAGVSFPGVQ